MAASKFSEKKGHLFFCLIQSDWHCACFRISLIFKIFHSIFYIFKINKTNNSINNTWVFFGGGVSISFSLEPSSSSMRSEVVTYQKTYDKMECMTVKLVSSCTPILFYKFKAVYMLRVSNLALLIQIYISVELQLALRKILCFHCEV